MAPRGSLVVASALLLGCNSAVDIGATRGSLSIHFSDVGCAVSYSGDRGAGPSAIDVTCPATLRAVRGAPTLHISTPLVTLPGPRALRDEHFREPGYQLGQFVVITYEAEGRTVTCDPLQAKGGLVYEAIPRPGNEGRISGRFSDDAALLNCHNDKGADGNVPLQLRGAFDLGAPIR